MLEERKPGGLPSRLASDWEVPNERYNRHHVEGVPTVQTEGGGGLREGMSRA